MKKKPPLPQLKLEELLIRPLPRGKRNIVAVYSDDRTTVMLNATGSVFVTNWRDGWATFPFRGFNRPKCAAVVNALIKLGALPKGAAEEWVKSEEALQDAEQHAYMADKVLDLVEAGKLSISQREVDKMEKLIDAAGINATSVGRVIKRKNRRAAAARK